MEEGRQESELLIIVRRLCNGNGCNVDVAGESGEGDEHPGTGGRLSYLVCAGLSECRRYGSAGMTP